MTAALDWSVTSIARNIVNQLGDLWRVAVATRQATNDTADEFVVSLIEQVTAEAQAELREAIVAAIRTEATTRYPGIPKPRIPADTAIRLVRQATP